MGGDEVRVSRLHLYSYGIAASNKALDSKMLSVTPVEDLPMVNGELSDNKDSLAVTSQDQDGTAYQVNAKTSNAVTAQWIPMSSSNRMTAPDVRRGERVVLYRFADSQNFFWTTFEDDMRLRKLETVVYAFSGTQNESDGTTADTSYFLEVSTHKGLMHVHTSKKNGEMFSYDIQINAKSGFIKIQDDAGNSFTLDSQEHQLAFENSDGSYIDVNKKNITISCSETYTLNCKNKTETIGENASTTAGQSITEKADSRSATMTSTITEKAPNVAIDGNTQVNGNLGTGGGDVTMNAGSLKVTAGSIDMN